VSAVAITQEQVAHVAKLARLALSDAELKSVTSDLGQILEHVEQLQRLDTTDVLPTQHVAVTQMPMRPDTQHPTRLSHDAALSGAPRVLDGGFVVPGFMED
jgi:aspartyl-tRNA(Asn)/glutamyl-tRNA(Gln) amidotransferase subunit C